MMSDELLDRDALIQTVAMKYGIIITKNDPMLVLLALHHEILGRYQEVMQQGFDGVQRCGDGNGEAAQGIGGGDGG